MMEWALSVMVNDVQATVGPRREPADRRSIALTGREREIAELVRVGLSNQEIALRLRVSRRTVESHLWRIFAKLGVRSRTAMTHRLTSGA
jgi:DNA-binding NarL/FixJ family response regulator